MTHPLRKDTRSIPPRNEPVSRLPVALGRDGTSTGARERASQPPPSETRLQSAVGPMSDDPYADPPCTD